MKNILVQIGCWLMIATPLAVGGVVLWMMAADLGFTWRDLLGMVKTGCEVGLALFVYRRWISPRPRAAESTAK